MTTLCMWEIFETFKAKQHMKSHNITINVSIHYFKIKQATCIMKKVLFLQNKTK